MIFNDNLGDVSKGNFQNTNLPIFTPFGLQVIKNRINTQTFTTNLTTCFWTVKSIFCTKNFLE